MEKIWNSFVLFAKLSGYAMLFFTCNVTAHILRGLATITEGAANHCKRKAGL